MPYILRDTSAPLKSAKINNRDLDRDIGVGEAFRSLDGHRQELPGLLRRDHTNQGIQGLEELARLRRKGMLAAVAGTVNPPNLSEFARRPVRAA